MLRDRARDRWLRGARGIGNDNWKEERRKTLEIYTRIVARDSPGVIASLN